MALCEYGSDDKLKCMDEFAELLKNGKKDESLALFHKEHLKWAKRDEFWELIPIIIDCFNEEFLETYPDMFNVCNAFLLQIAAVSNPKEIVIAFILQLHSVKEDLKFIALLKPLHYLLFKITTVKSDNVEKCLHYVNCYVKSLFPHNLGKCGIIQKTGHVKRVINIYSELTIFYKSCIEELLLYPYCVSSYLHKNYFLIRRDLVTCFLIRLLDYPLEHVNCKDTRSTSCVSKAITELVTSLILLVGDAFMIFEYVEIRERIEYAANDFDRHIVSKVDDVYLFLSQEKLPIVSISVYVYIVLVEGICIENVPCVYSPMYIVQKCLYLASKLLKELKDYLICRGILLLEMILDKIPELSITLMDLDSPVHQYFLKALVNVIAYNESVQHRKLAVKIFHTYLYKFNIQGRYFVLFNLSKIVTHASFSGYLIMQIKEIIFSLQFPSPYFSGNYLSDLIKQYVKLPNSLNNVVDVADQIISSLNLIRFLVLRDQDQLQSCDIENQFLKPLQNAINHSRNEYVHIQGEIEGKNAVSGDNIIETKHEKGNITIESNTTPPIFQVSSDEEHAIVKSAFTVLDLMESLLIRVNECITSVGNNSRV